MVLVLCPESQRQTHGGCSQEGNDREPGEEQDHLHLRNSLLPYNGYLVD